jgi:hypothetical protein
MGQELAPLTHSRYPAFPLVWTSSPKTVMFHCSNNYYGNRFHHEFEQLTTKTTSHSWRDSGSVFEIQQRQDFRAAYHSTLRNYLSQDVLSLLDEMLFTKADFCTFSYAGGN